MDKRYQRRSALDQLGLEARASTTVDDANVMLCESPFRGLLVLRGDGESPGFRSAVSAVLGVGPVGEPLKASRKRDVSVLWLGPDEWLVVTPDRRVARIESALRDALEGHCSALTDVSHSRTILTLSGPEARSVLAKGCPLDLHPLVFGPGRCAQSRLGKCLALIHQTNAAPTFDIYVSRSFAGYAWRWLEDAAGEFGVRIVSAK